MVTIRRTNNEDSDFIRLVESLDRDLLSRYGKAQEDYQPFNSIAHIREVVIASLDDVPVGCGCFKPWQEKTTELKRMYVKPGHRSLGIASRVLTELENWSAELGYERMILETGKGQPEAIRLYEKNGYTLIPNFGQYVGMPDSICMEKYLR